MLILSHRNTALRKTRFWGQKIIDGLVFLYLMVLLYM